MAFANLFNHWPEDCLSVDQQQKIRGLLIRTSSRNVNERPEVNEIINTLNTAVLMKNSVKFFNYRPQSIVDNYFASQGPVKVI